MWNELKRKCILKHNLAFNYDIFFQKFMRHFVKPPRVSHIIWNFHHWHMQFSTHSDRRKKHGKLYSQIITSKKLYSVAKCDLHLPYDTTSDMQKREYGNPASAKIYRDLDKGWFGMISPFNCWLLHLQVSEIILI